MAQLKSGSTVGSSPIITVDNIGNYAATTPTSSTVTYYLQNTNEVWTRPTGCNSIDVICAAGGGGGGSAYATFVDNAYTPDYYGYAEGSEGGAGGTAVLTGYSVANLNTAQHITVGAGGGSNGAGGSSSFGTICSANGGGGGTAANNNNQTTDGAAGSGVGGTVNYGQVSTDAYSNGGYYGIGQTGRGPGVNYGESGSGATKYGGNSAASGYPGHEGIIIVTEYYS